MAAADKKRKIANATKASRAIPSYFDILSGAGTYTGDYYGVQPLDAPAFSAMLDANSDAVTDVTELDNLPVGIVAPIAFKSVTLTSGSIIAYKR